MQDDNDQPRGPLVPNSDELLRLIFDSATDFAIFTIDPNGIVTSWNSGAERLFGFHEDEIIGRSADVLFPPEEGGANAAEDERRSALAFGRAEDERWQARKDGTRFWASGLLMPLADRTYGFTKIVRDRTEQHRFEERLRENEERFRLLATNIPQLVFRGKVSGERTWGSPQWSLFTGLSLPESVAFGWLEAIHPEDREATLAAWRTAQGQDQYYVEHRIRRSSNGDYRWHQTRAAPLRGAGEADEWVGTSTDIHDLRRLQDQQKVLLAELQHRTRNLLAVVQALARQTLRGSGSLEAFAAKFESRLRALSRAQVLYARMNNQAIDLRALVESELSAHGDGAADSDRIVIDGPPAQLPAVSAQTLVLALHELATNAVKYGALGQPQGKIVVTWDVAEKGTERHARLAWRESGVVMPDDGRPRRKGYGSELIEQALPYQLGAETKLVFGTGGVSCEITVPITGGEEERT